MRDRTQIEKDYKGYDVLTLEVLLDIRELLNKIPVNNGIVVKQNKQPYTGKPRGRPKKQK